MDQYQVLIFDYDDTLIQERFVIDRKEEVKRVYDFLMSLIQLDKIVIICSHGSNYFSDLVENSNYLDSFRLLDKNTPEHCRQILYTSEFAIWDDSDCDIFFLNGESLIPELKSDLDSFHESKSFEIELALQKLQIDKNTKILYLDDVEWLLKDSMKKIRSRGYTNFDICHIDLKSHQTLIDLGLSQSGFSTDDPLL